MAQPAAADPPADASAAAAAGDVLGLLARRAVVGGFRWRGARVSVLALEALVGAAVLPVGTDGRMRHYCLVNDY